MSRNGKPRDPDINRLLENAVRTKAADIVTPTPTDRALPMPFCHASCLPRAGFTWSSCASSTSLPSGAPDGTLPKGMPSPDLRPSPGAELNSSGNIVPPSALRKPHAHAAVWLGRRTWRNCQWPDNGGGPEEVSTWYRLVSNHKDEQHRTAPPEKKAQEATKPEATKDHWVKTGCPGDSAICALPTDHGGGVWAK